RLDQLLQELRLRRPRREGLGNRGVHLRSPPAWRGHPHRRRLATLRARRRSAICTRRGTSYPDAAELAEARLFGDGVESRVEVARLSPTPGREKPCVSRAFVTPRVRLERTTLRLTAGCSAN